MIHTHDCYLPLYQDKEKFIILVTGGRGSGKSFGLGAFIERLTFELSRQDGEKKIHNVLYTRYTMTSASISVIPEFLEKIEQDGTSRFFHSTKTDIVNLMTGARIMFRGIKTSSGNQTAKLKSIHGITTFVVDEAEEWTSEAEFETIMYSIRQKGIQNRIIIIMNPTDSNHFIYQKYIKDTHKLVDYDGVPVQISTHPNVLHIHTSFLDNKAYLSPQFIEEAQRMKETDPDRYAHVFMGRWTDVAEGAIFKKWGIVDEFPQNLRKVACGVDFGYTNDPTAIVRCGILDNRLYIDELCYKTHLLVSDLIREMRQPDAEGLHFYADSADPRLIQEIANGGVLIYPVMKGGGSIIAGIEKMKDMEIYVTKRSLNLQDELRNYTWDKDKDGNYINQPIDAYNHCFTADTLIETKDGEKRIADIEKGDYVLTTQGFKAVEKTFNNGIKEVVRAVLSFADGTCVTLNATETHQIKTQEGWKQLKEIKKGDVLFLHKSSMAKSITATQVNDISAEEQDVCTELCGNTTMARYLRATTYTTKMATRVITQYRTSNSSTQRNTSRCICKNAVRTRSFWRKLERICTKQAKLLRRGTKAKMGESGTRNTLLLCVRLRRLLANGAVVNLRRLIMELSAFAQTNAKQLQGMPLGLTMRNGLASTVGTCSLSTNTPTPISVQERVAQGTVRPSVLVEVEMRKVGLREVFDIQVEEAHEYFANGVLVHNCIDASRYFVLGHLLGQVLAPKKYNRDQIGIF